jgi:hypothetical protein
LTNIDLIILLLILYVIQVDLIGNVIIVELPRAFDHVSCNADTATEAAKAAENYQ